MSVLRSKIGIPKTVRRMVFWGQKRALKQVFSGCKKVGLKSQMQKGISKWQIGRPLADRPAIGQKNGVEIASTYGDVVQKVSFQGSQKSGTQIESLRRDLPMAGRLAGRPARKKRMAILRRARGGFEVQNRHPQNGP